MAQLGVNVQRKIIKTSCLNTTNNFIIDTIPVVSVQMVIVIGLLSTPQGRNFNPFIDRVITKHVLLILISAQTLDSAHIYYLIFGGCTLWLLFAL